MKKILIATQCVEMPNFFDTAVLNDVIIQMANKAVPFAGSVVISSGKTVLIFQQVQFVEDKDEKSNHPGNDSEGTKKNNLSALN